MKKLWVFLFTVLFIFGLTGMASATPVFYVNPGLDPSLDVTWQTAVGNQFVEFDFDDVYTVDQLSAGNITIDVGLFDVDTLNTADVARVFYGGYSGLAGGIYGTVFGGAILSKDTDNNAYTDITFTFSSPVSGFGAWVFDNSWSYLNSSLMTVTEVGGATSVSDILEIGNGTGHSVEGWLGVTSNVGITNVSYRVLDGNNEPDLQNCFEMDHIQVALANPVPEPSTWLLLFLGLIGIVQVKKKFN